MTRFLARKVARAIFTILFVLTFVFFVLRIVTDPVEAMVAGEINPELIEIYRLKFGLDQPIGEQFFRYLGLALQGDFGFSYRDARPAQDWIVERLPRTLMLSVPGFLLICLFGVSLGVAAALHHGTAFDRGVMSFVIGGYCLPSFVLGLLLMYIFAVWLGWLPSSGSRSWQHLILPVATYVLTGGAALARFTRSTVLEVLSQPYILGARAFGASQREIILRHALPNAAIPLVTILGFSVAGLIGGAIVIETIFAWPGLGSALVSAVSTRDLPVVHAIVILFAAVMVATNLLVDLLYGVLNPRIEVLR